MRTRLYDAVPWRVRRWGERAALRAMRFVPGLTRVTVSRTEPCASLVAVGDIALNGSLGVEGLFRDCDLRVGNLESPLTTADRPAGNYGALLKAHPDAVEVLKAFGFDAVTIANNHCLDYGRAGLLECIATLDAAGIAHCGGGPCTSAARRPVLLNANGVTVGMLGYCDDYRAAAGDGMVAVTSSAHDGEVLDDIRRLRAQVDLVIVQLHWGYEFAMYPLMSHRERARSFAAAGADLVLCHHAHVPMGVEVVEERLIAYGLGNFLFGLNDYVRGGHPWTDRSFALKVWFGKAGVSHAEIMPCRITPDRGVCLLKGAERAEILGAMRVLSAGLARTAKLAGIERDRLAREALSWWKAFSGCEPADTGLAVDRAWYLRSPRSQEMIGRLMEGSPANRAVGRFLGMVAEAAEEPGKVAGYAAESRREPLLSEMAQFRREARLPRENPGRVP